MVVIAVPLGGILAFVMERTDLPAKRWIEPLILVPSFVSPMVLAFGYVVAAGPGRLLYGLGDGVVRRRAVGHLFADRRSASSPACCTCPTSTSTRRRR